MSFRSRFMRMLRPELRPTPVEKRVAVELDPRPSTCDCGRDASHLTPDDNGHSWRCPCGLRY